MAQEGGAGLAQTFSKGGIAAFVGGNDAACVEVGTFAGLQRGSAVFLPSEVDIIGVGGDDYSRHFI